MAATTGDDFHRNKSFSEGDAPKPATGQGSESDQLGGMMGSAPDASGADAAGQALRNGHSALGATESAPSIGRERRSGNTRARVPGDSTPSAGILPTDGDDTAEVAAGENLSAGQGEDPTRSSSGTFGESAGERGDTRSDGGLFSKS